MMISPSPHAHVVTYFLISKSNSGNSGSRRWLKVRPWGEKVEIYDYWGLVSLVPSPQQVHTSFHFHCLLLAAWWAEERRRRFEGVWESGSFLWVCSRAGDWRSSLIARAKGRKKVMRRKQLSEIRMKSKVLKCSRVFVSRELETLGEPAAAQRLSVRRSVAHAGWQEIGTKWEHKIAIPVCYHFHSHYSLPCWSNYALISTHKLKYYAVPKSVYWSFVLCRMIFMTPPALHNKHVTKIPYYLYIDPCIWYLG